MDAARSVTANFTNSLSLSIDDTALDEGKSGLGTTAFAVRLSAPAAASVSVKYATANGTALAGSDYTAASGTLTFAPGETSKTVSVPVQGDSTTEADETFTVVLSAATNAPMSRSVGTATIRNDDFPALSVADVSLSEGNVSGASAVFTVTLSAPSPQTVAVNYTTANGTAAAGSDYAAISGNLTFAPGSTSRTVAVAIMGDTAVEADETFFLNLTSPAKATIARAQAKGTLLNDDQSGSQPLSEPVVWKSAVGVSVSGNSLTKTAATGWGNAGGVSTKALVSGSGYVEVTASEATTKRMFGLGNGNASTSYGDIEFAIYLDAGTVRVYEKGVLRGTFGTFVSGDKVRVAVESGVVKYRRNGTLLYSSAMAPVYPLRVDSAFNSQSATLKSAVVSGSWQ